MRLVLSVVLFAVLAAAAFGVVRMLMTGPPGRWLNGGVTRHPVVATVLVVACGVAAHYTLGW